MRRLSIDEVAHSPHPRGVTTTRRLLGEELGTEAGSVDVTAGEAIHFEPGDWQLGFNEGDEPVTAVLVGTPKDLSPVEAYIVGQKSVSTCGVPAGPQVLTMFFPIVYLPCPNCEDETRFSVEPRQQESGERMDEARVCERCGEAFDLDS